MDSMATHTSYVSGDYVPGSFGLLPLGGEHARDALPFARLLGSVPSDANLALARWYLCAALSAYRSIFALLSYDFRSIGLTHVAMAAKRAYGLS